MQNMVVRVRKQEITENIKNARGPHLSLQIK